MRAFAAQWIPLAPEAARLPSAKVETTVREAWRKVRREMLKAINRTSYRSVFTLYLFAQTPIPFGIYEDEELDGLNSLVCMQTALLQLQWLRSHRSVVQRSDAGTSESADDDAISLKYVDLESRAYWSAMTWDTSTSLLSDCRTSLTSGLKGACSEPTWRLVKAFLVGAFTPKTQKWHEDGFELNNRCVEEIMGAATICNTYIWKNVTSVKEALREGVSGGEVDFAWKALLDAFDIFGASIRPLLIKCDMMSPCLDQRLRLSLYQVQLRHCLGMLVLLEALEAAARSDLLGEVRSLNDIALTTCFDVLKFGLENSYSIESPVDESAHILGSRSDITSTLVAINPYPQYVVDMVLIMRKRLARNQNQSESIQDTFPHEMSILSRSLHQLPQSARSVQEALAKVSTLWNGTYGI
ncbi:hypothetical protein HBI83_096500 [Parastagonospora nodorum]|nr:hypothetical protein HBI83_096500 [Parastagonospora nodorum]